MPNPNVPVEHVAAAVKDLIAVGKVKHSELRRFDLRAYFPTVPR